MRAPGQYLKQEETRQVERWRVHKFGGSSVADAVCMERVARILEQDAHPRLGVVLSACRGVTDALLNLVTAAEKQESTLAERIEQLRRRHEIIAETLLVDADRREYMTTLEQDCRDIAGILQTVQLIRSASQTVATSSPATARSGRHACSALICVIAVAALVR